MVTHYKTFIECLDELWELHAELDRFAHPDFIKMNERLQTIIESLENLTSDNNGKQ